MKFLARFTLVLAFVVLTVGNSDATTWTVPGGQGRSIQSVINSFAEDHDTIYVQRGTYGQGYANNFWDVEITKPISIISLVGPTETIIQCIGDDNYIFSIQDDDVLIEGLTLKNATANAVVADGQSGLEIKNCIFFDNNLSADAGETTYGAAIWLNSTDAYVHHNIFNRNLAGIDGNGNGLSGGAIALTNNSELDLFSCFFTDNKSFKFGGAIYITSSGSVANIKNCVFTGNSTESANDGAADGGAIAVTGSATANVSFCNILYNEAGVDTDDDWGGGIYMGSNTRGDILNNIIWGNVGNIGTQVAYQNTGNPETDFCVIEGYNEEASDDEEAGNFGWRSDSIYVLEPEFEGGREPLWGVDGWFLADTLLIDRGSDDAEEFGMDTLSTSIKFNSDEGRADLGYHYYFWDFEIIGNLNGTVYKLADNSVIPFPRVTLHYSDDLVYEEVGFISGFYRFYDVPALPFWIEVEADGFLDSAKYDFELPENETMTINWRLLNPDIQVSQDEFDFDVENDEDIQHDYYVKNIGNGELTFKVEPRPPVEAYVQPWAQHAVVNIPDSTVDDGRLTGVVYAEDMYFVTGRNNSDPDSAAFVYVLNRDGEFQYRFHQPGVQNARRNYMEGLTFDGELLWGIKDAMLWSFSLEGEVQDTIELAVGATGRGTIAWDAERELFWTTTSATSDIFGISMEGRIEERIEIDPYIYGVGIYPDDRDGYDIYVTSKYQDFFYIYKVNPETGEYIEQTSYFIGDSDPGPGNITGKFDVQNWVFVMMMGGYGGSPDRVEVLQVKGNTSWMRPLPLSGTIAPRDSITASIDFLANGLPVRAYEGEIVYLHNASGLETHLPVSMNVKLDVNVDDYKFIPESFEIANVYPNPFNGRTTVVYNLPVSGHVDFRVFDITGREISSLAHGEYKQAGRQEITVNADHLPSGMYLMEIATQNDSKMTKVLLMK